MKTKNKFWFDRYKHCSNILNILMTNKSNKNHLRDFFQKHQNSKKMWTKINEILKNKTKTNKEIDISDNGTTLLDTNKFASKFNDYFINVSQNLKNLGKTNNQFLD